MKTPAILSPLRRSAFRLLWAGMGASYAGDRLQELAQAWLVAILTQSSALAVGWISILASVPQLFMPVGGAIADQADRRRLLISGQLVGAAAAAVVGALVLTHRIAAWHIYVWAFASGTIWLLSRPAYKVVLTEAVPLGEVRSAVAINSMTETAVLVISTGAGSILLGVIGLPIAFLLNSWSYVVAAGCLWRLRSLTRQVTDRPGRLSLQQVSSDLRDGVVYLVRQPRLLHPLLLTFTTVMITTPSFGLLAAVVHKLGGSIVNLGLLMASASLGGTVDLVQLYESERSMGGRIIYEPDQFPGLMYRITEPKAVVLIFSSGKMVCAGARTEGSARQAVERVRRKLDEKGLIHYG